MNRLAILLFLQTSATVMAQIISPRPPDPLARRAAPATTQSQNGVRNGTTRQERDQHVEPDAPNQTQSSPDRQFLVHRHDKRITLGAL